MRNRLVPKELEVV